MQNQDTFTQMQHRKAKKWRPIPGKISRDVIPN